MNIPSLTLKEIFTEPGVKDLQPLSCRAAFARALKFEREDDAVKAAEQLDVAIAAEEPKPA
jgi:hypothetical protein